MRAQQPRSGPGNPDVRGKTRGAAAIGASRTKVAPGEDHRGGYQHDEHRHDEPKHHAIACRHGFGIHQRRPRPRADDLEEHRLASIRRRLDSHLDVRVAGERPCPGRACVREVPRRPLGGNGHERAAGQARRLEEHVPLRRVRRSRRGILLRWHRSKLAKTPLWIEHDETHVGVGHRRIGHRDEGVLERHHVARAGSIPEQHRGRIPRRQHVPTPGRPPVLPQPLDVVLVQSRSPKRDRRILSGSRARQAALRLDR